MIRFFPLAIALGALSTASASEPRGYVMAGISLTPGHKVPIGLGLEIAYASEPENGQGPTPETFLQLDVRGLHTLRFAAGGRAGWSLPMGNDAGTIPSLGAGFALQSDGGHGLHVDAGARQLLSHLGLQLRTDLTVPVVTGHRTRFALTAAGGAALGSIEQSTVSVSEGRPIRTAGQPVLPSVLAPARLDALAEHWLERARTEHASIPAFLQLAAELRALGAPDALVARALSAAADERRHARVCYARVHQLAGAPVWVGPTPGWSVRGGTRHERLARIASEALSDGIIGEGDAADRASHRRDASTDDTVARVEHLIATEERGHATLAEDVWMWARSAA